MAARKLLKDTCELAAEILDGKHDDDLSYIAQACAARVKRQFTKGQRVKLTGTKNPTLEGKVGTILKVNTKTVSVGLGKVEYEAWDTARKYGMWSDGEINAPPSMLTTVDAL